MSTPRIRFRRLPALLLAGFLPAVFLAGWPAPARDLDPRIQEIEARRVAVVEKVRPSVVAVFGHGGQGGGSGVVISPDGYALTNFHVVSGMGPAMQCGLPDGNLYDAVLVGLDKVGDVALIKLLPKKEGDTFPFAQMGDSDKLRPGDWSLAMGNPFLLATDFTPTVTFGMISGTNRYQYPAGTLLEYTDCIQFDTSINPGNSGGPLFNMDGELIGINGRGSFEKRGRVNVGVGYAISINQIKNFMGHLRAGIDTDHATLGARIIEHAEEGAGSLLLVGSILEESDAYRRGLEPDDELVSFAGRPMSSVNQFKNVLGLFPRGWRVPLVYRRNNTKHEILVRLMGVLPQESLDPNRPQQPPGQPPGRPRPRPPMQKSPATKLYEAKAGFANYYFNRQERDRLLEAFKKHGDFSELTGAWTLGGKGEIKKRAANAVFIISEEKEGATTRPVVRSNIAGVDFSLHPLKPDQDIRYLKDPPGSGGILAALYQYRLFLTVGEKGFEGGFHHGGQEPFYPLPADDKAEPDYEKLRVDCAVLRTEHAGVPAKWYFSLKDHTLLGFEVWVDDEDDPCEVYLSDYRAVDGRMLPHRIEVRYGNERYANLTDLKYDLARAR